MYPSSLCVFVYLVLVLNNFISVDSIDNKAFANVLKRGSACGGVSQSINISPHPGIITSPGYPHHFYPSESLCRWNLTAPLRQRIHIKSHLFALESTPSCLFDHLLIYNGPTDKDDILGRFCGHDTFDVVTSSNHAYLVFFSDISYEDRGFNITYERTTLRSRGRPVPFSHCNRTILSDSEHITSPDYPLPYTSNARCSFTLRAPEDFVVDIVFKHFSLERDRGCRNDFIAVYDGKDQDAPLLGRYCGNEHPERLRSQGNHMYIYFQSDEYFELGGFNLTCRFLSVADKLFDEKSDGGLIVSGDPDCSGIKEDSRGEITSPMFPVQYPPLKKCIVILRAPDNHVISISFREFLLEYSVNCEFDWLRILDGESSESAVVGRYCSDSLANLTVTPRRQFVRLEFQSDVSVGYTGFRADYRVLKEKREIAKNVSECSLRCVNGGVCMKDESGTHCTCPIGWAGRRCGVRVASCADMPCLHGGTCSPTQLSYRCKCSHLYVGKHCESRTSLRFTSVPRNTTVRIGEKGSLRCGANHGADIVWKFEDISFEEGDGLASYMGVVVHKGGVLEITSFAEDNSGKYTCTARRETEHISTDAWITSKPPCPSLVRTPPNNVTMLQDDRTHRFTCVVLNGLKDIAIAWEKDDVALVPNDRIKVSNNGMLIVERVGLSDAGKYTCVARSASGCVKRHIAWMNVRRRDVCGRVPEKRTRKKSRITQGTLADDAAHPWFALLRNPTKNGQRGLTFCGASVINRRWVVTAAHCLKGNNPFSQTATRVYVGTNDCLGVGGVEAKVERVVVHPDFVIKTLDNDIALLKLKDTLRYNETIKPICLKPRAYIKAKFLRQKKYGTVAGCGALVHQGYGARRLMQVKVPLRSRAECRSATENTVTKGMLCAGYRRPSRGDSCQGDSGGPYTMTDEQGAAILVGIVSWGKKCDEAGKYGYYTNVGAYYDWINKILVQYGET